MRGNVIKFDNQQFERLLKTVREADQSQALSDLKEQNRVLALQIHQLREIVMAIADANKLPLRERKDLHDDMTRLHNDVDDFLRGFYGLKK